MSALYDRSAGLLRQLYDRRLSAPPVLDAERLFPAHRRYLARWPELRAEALALLPGLDRVPRFHELMAAQADISDADQRAWRMFVLKAYGVPIPENQRRCPLLADLVESCPDVLSAALSYLAPFKHIPEHRGPFRGVLRFYLGLSVPSAADGLPATELRIDGCSWRIAEGQGLLWDDTFPHEVRHDSAQPRIALLLDVRRRGMPPDLSALSRLLIAAAGTVVRIRRRLPGDPFALPAPPP